MSKIFKGTTAECFQHLGRAIQGEHLFENRKLIADFAGVESPAVYRWFRAGKPPLGESLLRLRFYMEFLGYEVAETEALDPVIRDAARLCAFRVISMSETASLVGYPAGVSGMNMLHRVFHGKNGVHSEKLEHFKSLVDLYAEQLPERQRATPKLLKGSVRVTPPMESQAASRPSVVHPLRTNLRPTPQLRDALIESLAGSVKGMIPLAQAISSDDFTPEERARLRELAGGNGVFNLANLLYRLCGERARKMHS